jgi:hypothetical protein
VHPYGVFGWARRLVYEVERGAPGQPETKGAGPVSGQDRISCPRPTACQVDTGRVALQIRMNIFKLSRSNRDPFAIHLSSYDCFSCTSVPSVVLYVVEFRFSRGFESYLRSQFFSRVRAVPCGFPCR